MRTGRDGADWQGARARGAPNPAGARRAVARPGAAHARGGADEAGGRGGGDAVADTVVLLASELCENAVLHAGTEFEVALRIDDAEVVVTVSDRGAGPLEQHLAQPRRRYGRAAAHGRGLALLSRLATAWGTRHEQDGTHRTWFSVATGPATADDRPVSTPASAPAAVAARPAVPRNRRSPTRSGGARPAVRARAPAAAPAARPRRAPRRRRAGRGAGPPAVGGARRRGRRRGGRRGRRRGAAHRRPVRPAARGRALRERRDDRRAAHHGTAARQPRGAPPSAAPCCRRTPRTSPSWWPTASRWPSSRPGCATWTSGAAPGWPTWPTPASCSGSRWTSS